MLATKIKFGLLAAACLAAGAPVIGNLQREAAPKRQTSPQRIYFERSEQDRERSALRHWLMARPNVESVVVPQHSPAQIEVALTPNTSRTTLRAHAHAVAEILNQNFHNSMSRPVMEVDLRSNRGTVAIMPYSNGGPPLSQIRWRVFENGRPLQ